MDASGETWDQLYQDKRLVNISAPLHHHVCIPNTYSGHTVCSEEEAKLDIWQTLLNV